MSKPDYILDLSHANQTSRHDASADGSPAQRTQGSSQTSSSAAGKPWIAVNWKCCQTYSRIYRNKAGTAYEGRCPKCGSPVKASIGQGGTNQRFFEAQ